MHHLIETGDKKSKASELSFTLSNMLLKGVMIILKIYTVLFATGILYALISFILGNLFDCFHFDTHLDFHGGTSHFSVFPIKPITIIIFITVFGGLGAMQVKLGISPILTFLIALISAIIASFFVYRFIVVPLYKMQNTSSVSQKELIGNTAIVIGGIMENGFGKIEYIKNGVKYTAPCKHIEGKKVDFRTVVTIISIEDNVFYIM